MGYCFCIYPPPKDAPVPQTFLLNNGLGILPWGTFISDWHTKSNMISICVPGLGHWFCLQCLGPCMNKLSPVWWSTSRLIFKLQFLCKSAVLVRHFLLRSSLYSCFIHCISNVNYFSSQITIYSKYSIPMVSTIANWTGAALLVYFFLWWYELNIFSKSPSFHGIRRAIDKLRVGNYLLSITIFSHFHHSEVFL